MDARSALANALKPTTTPWGRKALQGETTRLNVEATEKDFYGVGYRIGQLVAGDEIARRDAVDEIGRTFWLVADIHPGREESLVLGYEKGLGFPRPSDRREKFADLAAALHTIPWSGREGATDLAVMVVMLRKAVLFGEEFYLAPRNIAIELNGRRKHQVITSSLNRLRDESFLRVVQLPRRPDHTRTWSVETQRNREILQRYRATAIQPPFRKCLEMLNFPEMSLREEHILRTVYALPGLTMNDLAQTTGIHAGGVRNHVKRLEDLDLVYRHQRGRNVEIVPACEPGEDDEGSDPLSPLDVDELYSHQEDEESDSELDLSDELTREFLERTGSFSELLLWDEEDVAPGEEDVAPGEDELAPQSPKELLQAHTQRERETFKALLRSHSDR